MAKKKPTEKTPASEETKARVRAVREERALKEAEKQTGLPCARPARLNFGHGAMRLAKPADAAACFLYSMGHECEYQRMLEMYRLLDESGEPDFGIDELAKALMAAAAAMSDAIDRGDMRETFIRQTHVLMIAEGLTVMANLNASQPAATKPVDRYEVN